MKQKEIKKEMVFLQSVFPNAGIEWVIGNKILFVWFKSGSFSCPCLQLTEIVHDSTEIIFRKGKKLDVRWRSSSETMLTICYC